jgi:hypothetical protein
MSVRDGKGIAPRSVACTEVAFEVHALIRRSTRLTNVCANVSSAILKDAQSSIKQFALSLLVDIRQETQSCSPQ